MTNPVAGGNKFQAANQGLQRKFQMGGSPLLTNAPVQAGGGNIPVAPGIPDVAYTAIGKGENGVRGASPIRLMGSTPFASQMGTPGMGDAFLPAPQPEPIQMGSRVDFQAPAPQPASLGANDEVHRLVAQLQGPSGARYEAVYEVVVPERGSRVLGVVERPIR